MRNILILLFMVFSLFSVSAAQDKSEVVPVQGPQMKLAETAFDFGEIEEGIVATHVFKFRNIGTDTLYIKKVSGG